MFSKIIFILGALAMLLANCHREAEASTFDFKDPKSISAIGLTIDSMLEPIVGWAKGISGTVNFDPKNPLATTGKIAVDVSSIQFANEGYTATARGFALNGAKYPQIFFTLRKVVSVSQTAPNVFKANVQAEFTCRGVAVPLTVAVTANYFPGKAEERTNGQHKGDLLVLRANFEVSRAQYGISEGIPENLVGDKIEARVAVVGICYAPGQQIAEATVQPSSAFPSRKTPVRAQLNQAVTLSETLPEIRADHSQNLVALSDWNRDKTRVLFFFNEQCGVTYFYKQRLQQLQKDFEGKGFTFLGIRCGRREKPDAPLTLAEARYLKMTFVDDVEGRLADVFQIKQSLTFAVLDPRGKLRYFGGFDDNVTEARVQQAYLRHALQELAAGKPVTIQTGKAMGCAIIPVHAAK